MKKAFQSIKKYGLLSFFFLVLFACKDSGSPQSIAKLFLISLNKSDMETARNISTKNTRDILKIWETLTKGKISEDEMKKREENFKVNILKVTKDSDSTVIVKYATQPQLLPFDQLRMLKTIDKDGRERWKVDISTLDLNTGADMYNNDTANDGQQIHPEPDSIATPE